MSRILTITLVVFAMFSLKAFAQSTDTETGQFKVNIITPLSVTIENDGGESDLGNLPKGSTKNLTASNSIIFRVDGYAGMQFSADGSGEILSDDEEVSLSGIQWEYQNDGNYATINSFPFLGSLNANDGQAWIRVYPQSITSTSNANDGSYSFDFTLTCTYTNL